MYIPTLDGNCAVIYNSGMYWLQFAHERSQSWHWKLILMKFSNTHYMRIWTYMITASSIISYFGFVLEDIYISKDMVMEEICI